MKKKLFSILALFIMIFSLTGCMKYNALMEIKEDKSMNFSIIYAMANSILEMSDDENNELMTEEQKQELINQGFQIENYADDTYTGFQITKTINNIDDVSSESDVVYSLSGIFDEKSDTKIFKVAKGTDKNIYTANFKFDANDNNSDNETDNTITEEENKIDENIVDENLIQDTTTNDNDESEDTNNEEMDLSGLESLTSSLDLKYVVKLPSAALSSNAKEKSEDGRELTWKLSSSEIDTIQFQFELKNKTSGLVENSSGNIPLPLIIGIALVVIIILVVIIMKSKKGKNNIKNEAPVVPTELTSVSNIPENSNNIVAPTNEPIQAPQTTPPIQVSPVNPVNQYDTTSPNVAATSQVIQQVQPVTSEEVVTSEVTPTVVPQVEIVASPVTKTEQPVVETVTPVNSVETTVTEEAPAVLPVQPTIGVETINNVEVQPTPVVESATDTMISPVVQPVDPTVVPTITQATTDNNDENTPLI